VTVEVMRRRAAETVVDLFRADESVAVVLGEISTDLLRGAFEHDRRRAVNVGIMEQAMIGVAAGFALEGFRPIVHTIAPFLVERPFEQLKLDFGYQRLEGLFISVGASYDYGTSGMTHHGAGDVAAVSAIPGFEAVVPGTAAEAEALVRATYRNGRPTYLRTAVRTNRDDHELAPGGLTPIVRGRGPTIVAVGPMLDPTVAALDGLDATILYATTVVPLDAATLAREAAGAEVLVVEPFYEGTLTAQVAAALAERPVRIGAVGVPRRVIDRYGTVDELDRVVGLDAAGIRERARAFLAAG
jgi:transketolase